MTYPTWWCLSLTFAALALVPTGAHLAEFAHKIVLPPSEYLVVQQIYAGWALFGFLMAGALISTGVLTVLVRKQSRTRALTLAAFACIVATQAVFWIFTQPVNRATGNWTVLPENWLSLRTQWEYSHAASAVLNLAALLALVLAVTRPAAR